MEYGFDLNRISGSVTLGSFSASQTVPADPDYIPHTVYDVLQNANLYTPIGYLRSEDLHRVDDEEAITYGVRFKGLERVKDITIAKSEKQNAAKEAKNIDLAIPTLERMKEEVAALGKQLVTDAHKTIIGNKTVADVATMNSTIATFNASNAITLDDGRSYSVANSVPGDIIFFEVTAGKNEEAIVTTGGNLILLTSNNEDASQIRSLETGLQAVIADKLNTSEGDVRYIKVDGANDMAASYVPKNAKSVAVKENVDSAVADAKQGRDALDARVKVLEDAESLVDLVYK